MYRFFFIVLFSIFVPSFLYAIETPVKNAGFVPANIWFSRDPFFDGEKIRVYTILFNGSTYDIDGTVEFLDNEVLIGKTTFALSGGGRVRDVWVDWKAKEGKHVMTARIVGATASVAGEAKRSIVLDNTETGKSERNVDFDTDGDGIGNNEDSDDDNDGVPDVEELRNGTNPIKKDSDGNGVSDGKELEILTKQKEASARGVASTTAPEGTILGTLKKVEETIPVPVKTTANSGFNALERFRVSEGYQARLAKENKLREIKGMASSSALLQKSAGTLDQVSNTAEKPFAYVMLAILVAMQYFLEWQIIFYGVVLYILYRLIRFLARRIRDR